METENWKPVVGYSVIEGFAEVSNLGRVRTLDSVRTSKRALQPTQLKRGCVLSPWRGKNGYLHVALKIGPKRTKYLVHRLVGFAFVPGYFEGASIDHINGDKLDNRAENLQWVTLARNTALQWQTGLVDIRGERHPSAKISDAQVGEIRAMLATGERVVEIAERYNVSVALIYKIKSGEKKAWLAA